ncbi:MAG: response regulator transcription factor [Proteobacteria bacterium]|nr:response regulator transcription factor [Pseudomonadota bacterium]
MSSWQPHILVVDDDKRLRDLLRQYLMDQGYLVSTAVNSADALQKLQAVLFDLVVLDVMMPGEDGFALTRRLRQERAFKNLPILFLTARGESADRITGLEAGSDDYLIKPFEPRELQLRIAAILRRVPKDEQSPEVWIGRWLYDRVRGELRDATDILRLTDVEASLLKILAEAPGETISREELVKRSNLPVNDRTVDVQVTRLRRKIEPDPKQPRYLVTVRGEGYRLLPEREKVAL